MNWQQSLIAVLAGLALAPARAGVIDLPIQIGGAYSVPATSLREARFSATIRQQYDFSCGSAALSTLLTHHYGYPVTEAQVFEQMFRDGDQAKIRVEGFSLLDMKRYLEAHGFESDGFQEPLQKLAAVKIPAIVLISQNGYNHFVVVKGLRDGRVLVGDPSGGTRSLSAAAFRAAWVNQVLFVISNRQEAAAFNLARDWRVAPRAPIGRTIGKDGLGSVLIPKLGSADF